MTTNENKPTREVTITTATIDFGSWKLEATGLLGESWEWRFEMSFPTMIASRDWKENQYFSDEEELEEYMWEEVQRLNKKYSSCVFTQELEEIENEDYYEEDED